MMDGPIVNLIGGPTNLGRDLDTILEIVVGSNTKPTYEVRIILIYKHMFKSSFVQRRTL